MPLLVLRAPDDAAQREQLGEMWGAYFSLAPNRRLPDPHSSELRLADLAMCEIVCAMDADVIRELPVICAQKSWMDGIALLVEPADSSVKLVPGPVILVPWMKEHAERQAGKLELLTELNRRLHTVLAFDLTTLRRRAHENFECLDEAQKKSLSALALASLADKWRAAAEQAPACLRLLVESPGEFGGAAGYWLASTMESRLEGPIGGSRWETPWWERSVNVMEYDTCVTGPCGMSMTPVRSVRFLRYFTQNGEVVPAPQKPAK